MTETPAVLKRTALYDAHKAQGARIVPFAGYEMPVQFPLGIIEEHNHTRTHASLFDVSHMGQITLHGAPTDKILKALEVITPSSLLEIKNGAIKYSALLNETGGVVDDIMITRPETDMSSVDLVINASRIEVDLAFLKAHLPANIQITHHTDRALLALQGPEAAQVLQQCLDANSHLPERFMTRTQAKIQDIACTISRCGYTGEDGFEISIPSAEAEHIYSLLLSQPNVKPAGLGARDTLRLEAGLCLYGQDLNESISPVEADIGFIIGKRRREHGGFHGEQRIIQELRTQPRLKRVGLLLEGRAPARSNCEIHVNNKCIGEISSGSFSPTLNAPIAFGFIPPEYATHGHMVEIILRGKPIAARVTVLPFVPHRYYF